MNEHPTSLSSGKKKQGTVSHPSPPFFTQKRYLIPLIIAGIIYLAINVLIFTCSTKIYCFPTKMIMRLFSSKRIAPLPTPTIRSIRPITSGRQEYIFSHGSGVIGPKLQQVIIDELTPERNSRQTVTATIKHDSPVTSAVVRLHTDTMTVDFPLGLASGSATNGTWTGQWQMTDTYRYNYYLQFILQSATGNYDHGLRFRP